MPSYRRNLMVGVVVLTGLGILGWMILQFGGSLVTPFSEKQIPIKFVAMRADGVSEGSPILYRGLSVGRVLTVKLDNDQQRIFMDAVVGIEPPLPANVSGYIVTQGLVGGGARLELRTPMGVKPTGQIKPNQLFDTDYIGLELLPPEFVDLSAQLRVAVKQFSDANVVGNVNDKLNRLGTLIDSANKFIGDEKMQSDVKQAIANFKEVSAKIDKLAADANAAIAQAKTTLAKADGKVDELSGQLSARLAEVSKLLGEVTTAAAKINAGEGTAGKLVNDPKLYEGLVLTVESLNSTVKDLQRLIQQWEQEGASIKLK